jgi:hypothetical protein
MIGLSSELKNLSLDLVQCEIVIQTHDHLIRIYENEIELNSENPLIYHALTVEKQTIRPNVLSRSFFNYTQRKASC